MLPRIGLCTGLPMYWTWQRYMLPEVQALQEVERARVLAAACLQAACTPTLGAVSRSDKLQLWCCVHFT